MKASSATSATAIAQPRPTGQSSDKRQPSPTSAEGFALAGPSKQPDPAANAYRKDLADIALAGEVIASHYAEPLHATLACDTQLWERPAEDSPVVALLAKGDSFDLLDNTLGWAWGYAGPDRRVGYVRSEALAG